MFKRSTDDPLLRIFLDKYNLNLLSIPRENVAVGDLYVYDGKRVSTPGIITYFLDPPLEIPSDKIITGERLADVTGRLSNGIHVNAGLGILDGFLTAMGAGGIVTKVRASYEAKGMKTLKFHFDLATRDYVDAFLFGRKLIGHRVMEEHPLYIEGCRYYLTTAVVRSSSISIIAEGDNATSVNIDLEAMKIAEASAAVSTTKSGEGEVTFIGKKKLAFGVELYELHYDAKRKTLKLLPPGVIQVRGGPAPVVKPAFIGGPDGEVFIKVD